MVLSGTYDIPAVGVKDEPVEGNWHRLRGVLWREMEAAGAALSAAVTGGDPAE